MPLPYSPQYTEYVRPGGIYRISEPGQSFTEFMATSPLYAHDLGQREKLNYELRRVGAADTGRGIYTRTDFQARVLVEVKRVERRTNSRYGNPRWYLHTSEGRYATEDDASLGYGIENMTNSRIPETYILDSCPAVLVLNKTGKVTHIERDGKNLDK